MRKKGLSGILRQLDNNEKMPRLSMKEFRSEITLPSPPPLHPLRHSDAKEGGGREWSSLGTGQFRPPDGSAMDFLPPPSFPLRPDGVAALREARRGRLPTNRPVRMRGRPCPPAHQEKDPAAFLPREPRRLTWVENSAPSSS